MQKIVLGAVATCVVGFCAYYFLLAPLWADIDSLNQKIVAERKLLAENQALKASSVKVDAMYRETGGRLLGMMANQMPPKVNPLAWSTDYLKGIASKSGVAEAGTSPFPAPGLQKEPQYEEYLIKTNLFCSFHELGATLLALEKGNPLIRVDGVEISTAEKGAVEKLSAGVQLAFLRFNDKKFLPEERPLGDETGVAFPPRRVAAPAEKAAAVASPEN